MQPMERGKPLKACPDLSCRRLKACHRKARGKACLKTHYRNDDEFYDFMTAKINRLCRGAKPDPHDTRSDDEKMADLRKIFVERLRELEASEGRKL
jgi:hypothetical protein